jgi:hypothetical protein
VIELKEHVIQMLILVLCNLKHVEVGRDVVMVNQILRSDLADVQVNQVAVVSIDLKQLFICETLCVNVVLDVDMFMGKNH